MERDHKQIDLHRHEYRADGVKEPFFSYGWPIGVATLITIAVGVLFHDTSAAVHVFGAIAGSVLVSIFYQFL